MPDIQTESSRPRWTRRDWQALLLCALVGLLLAVLPHFATWFKYGTAQYLADGDDVFYLAVARIPAQGESTLRDPFARPSDNVPSLYGWLQFVPLAKVSAWLGMPPILMSILWRVVGGILFGASLFILFRVVFRGIPHALTWTVGCAVFCLSDAGFSQGRMLLENLILLGHMVQGTTPLLKADALPQYRVVTPLLNLPFFLLLAACVIGGVRRVLDARKDPAVERPRLSWPAAAAGAVLLAFCFHLYFFFWTAAGGGLGLYLLISLFRAWRDPLWRPLSLARAKLCGVILAGGFVLGAPQVYSNYRTFADDRYQPILQRLSRGRDVSADTEIRFRYLKNHWIWLKLGIGAIGILVFRRRRLTLLWCLTLAGYLLVCSALVTRLEFENFHWSYVHAAFGEILVLGTLGLVLAPRLVRWGRWQYALMIIPLGLFLVAAAWRPYEAIRAPEAAWNNRTLAEMRPLRPALEGLGPDCVLAGPKEANIALLFSRCGQLYQFPYTAHSSVIPDDEVNRRHALSAWLQGIPLAEYEQTAGADTLQAGASLEPSWQPEALAKERTRMFQLVLSDPRPLLERYRPNALLLRVNAVPPSESGEWRLVQSTSGWALWVKD